MGLISHYRELIRSSFFEQKLGGWSTIKTSSKLELTVQLLLDQQVVGDTLLLQIETRCGETSGRTHSFDTHPKGWQHQ